MVAFSYQTGVLVLVNLAIVAGLCSIGRAQSMSGAPDGDANQPTKTADESTRLVPKWTVFKHPMGAFMEYPPEWRVEQTPQGVLAIIPPDFAMGQEMMIAFGMAAQGITDPADPRVGASMDATIGVSVSGTQELGLVRSPLFWGV